MKIAPDGSEVTLDLEQSQPLHHGKQQMFFKSFRESASPSSSIGGER